jgi:hypothetical protein
VLATASPVSAANVCDNAQTMATTFGQRILILEAYYAAIPVDTAGLSQLKRKLDLAHALIQVGRASLDLATQVWAAHCEYQVNLPPLQQNLNEGIRQANLLEELIAIVKQRGQ